MSGGRESALPSWDGAPRGAALVVLGIALLVGTLAVSAATAPSLSTAPDDDDGERLTLVGSQGGGPGWHRYGSVYLLDGSETVWRADDAESYFDVTATDDGSVLAGFMDGGATACGPYPSPCSRTGFRIIEPQPTPRSVGGYDFPVRTKKNSEVHDVERLPSGGYLLTDMEHERIFVVEDGTVTWQWNASARYDPPPDPTRTDWLHINDVDVIAEGRYLVSVRNANQLVVVDRAAGVVDVINEDRSDRDDSSCRGSGQLRDTDGDGDVRCGDPDVLDHQHNPQWLGDGAVLVADSDNDRVVELHERDGEWTVAWRLSRAGDVALSWPRDADRLPNGNTLITDTLNRRIVEVNRSGTVVWSYETDRIPYEADRLPAGEPVGGVAYGAPGEGARTVDSEVPVLSRLLVGIRAVYPGLPFWFGWVQLLATLVSVGLVGAGSFLAVRDRSTSG